MHLGQDPSPLVTIAAGSHILSQAAYLEKELELFKQSKSLSHGGKGRHTGIGAGFIFAAKCLL
jgi:hypothetical protein